MDENVEYVFRKNDRIGDSSAELDDKYLSTCFNNNGDLDIISDEDDPRRLVRGRTGIGKTALLLELFKKNPNNVIWLELNQYALEHLSNSIDLHKLKEVFKFSLVPIYREFWRHVFAVELIRKNFVSRDHFENFLCSIDKSDRKFLENYFEEWGNEFWEASTIDYITHLIKKDKNIKAKSAGSIGVPLIAKLYATLESNENITEEFVAEIKNRQSRVIMPELVNSLKRVYEIFSKEIYSKKPTNSYIVIDKLDSGWIYHNIKFDLIFALIDAARVIKIPNVKILIAIRKDIFEKISTIPVDEHFQEEKFRSLCLDIRWEYQEIEHIIDLRIQALVYIKYSKKSKVRFRDIFSEDITEPVKYILERTFLRPRDAILFVNLCLTNCHNEPKITKEILKKAYREYSFEMLKAIRDEWKTLYSEIEFLIEIFCKKKPVLRFSDYKRSKKDHEKLFETIIEKQEEFKNGSILSLLDQYTADRIDYEQILKSIFDIYYKVSVIGYEFDDSIVHWSYLDPISYSITNSTKIHIHKAIWPVLNIDAPIDL